MINIPEVNGVGRELPKYKCYKEVWALKIGAIEFEENGFARLAPADGQVFAPFKIEEDYRSKFKGSEEDLGYYVVYKDGYKSWSPTKAFEEGYTRVLV